MKLSIPSNLNTLMDNQCCADDNLQHLLHTFEGYRDKMNGINEDECQYSPDSLRAFSWTMGNKIAEQDLSDITTEGNK